MRFVYVIMLSVMLAINSFGCAASSPTDSTSPPVITEPLAASSTKSNTQEDVTIKSSCEKPLSLTNKETILLEGLQDGEEYIEVIVNGDIFDFEQIAVIWDESKNELVEKETVKSIEKIAYQTLVIKTYQPEGIPGEKIKWKSRTGQVYEYIIQQDGTGEAANSITKFDMNTPEINESNTTPLWEIKEKINPSMAEFTFSVYGKKNEDMYSANKIIIKKSQDKSIIQELDFDFTETPDIEKLGIEIEDMNFDGYKDIRIQQALPAGPNIPYYYWLWDKASTKYIRNQELEEITSPEFNSANKTIISSVRENAFTYYDRTYKYNDGIPTLMLEIERVGDGDKKAWNITVRELNGKEMKVVKEYTEPLEE